MFIHSMPPRRLAATLGLFISIALAAAAAARADDYGNPPYQRVDDAKVLAAGIRKLESRRLTLYTDLPSSPDVDELPQVFDQAFDLWCKYLHIDPAKHADWRMRGSIIVDEPRFVAAGLLPTDLPKFLNGYTRGQELWLFNQTSPYYRRHLFLHEGVHGIMLSLVGTNAAPWYWEGMAELLATHRWQNGRLELPYFPAKAADVPKLGRIEIMQTELEKRRAKQFADVVAYQSADFLAVEPYGWSWGAVAFLNGHPRYRDRFPKLLAALKEPGDFNGALREIYADDFDKLAEEWQVFLADVVHGYDFDRTAIDFAPGKSLAADRAEVKVAADRGWQNTGLALEAGKTYQLTATGQFQIAKTTKPWISEPNGVSIRYNHGKPLGILLAAIRPEKPTGPASPFLKPIRIGSAATITPDHAGTLYLKLNDSAGELGDNSGHATVEIRRE